MSLGCVCTSRALCGCLTRLPLPHAVSGAFEEQISHSRSPLAVEVTASVTLYFFMPSPGDAVPPLWLRFPPGHPPTSTSSPLVLSPAQSSFSWHWCRACREGEAESSPGGGEGGLSAASKEGTNRHSRQEPGLWGRALLALPHLCAAGEVPSVKWVTDIY